MIPATALSILLRYVLPGAAAVALLFGAYEWAHSQGYHSRDTEVANLKTNAAALTSNNAFLTTALADQNKAVLAAKADGDARVAAGQQALETAKKQSAALAATADALRKSATVKHRASDPCTISPTLAKARL